MQAEVDAMSQIAYRRTRTDRYISPSVVEPAATDVGVPPDLPRLLEHSALEDQSWEIAVTSTTGERALVAHARMNRRR
jgi:hypothetical protein